MAHGNEETTNGNSVLSSPQYYCPPVTLTAGVSAVIAIVCGQDHSDASPAHNIIPAPGSKAFREMSETVIFCETLKAHSPPDAYLYAGLLRPANGLLQPIQKPRTIRLGKPFATTLTKRIRSPQVGHQIPCGQHIAYVRRR